MHPSALPFPLFSLDSPLGSYLISCGSAVVFLGILLLIFSMMNSPSIQGEKSAAERAAGYASAERATGSASVPRALPKLDNPEPAVVSVAQITGKVDCVWVDKTTAPAWHKIKVSDKFELKSGLMEITYYTGAKVILQGPCTYEVDSATGGYLSLGKLTARVEKKGAGGAGRGTGEETVASGQWSVASEAGEREEGRGESAKPQENPPSALRLPPSSSPQPLAPSPSALFAVRTPTAVVTDLGTEFGVEVDKSGRTESRVFRGKVIVAAVTADGKQTGESHEVVLSENESVAIVSAGDSDAPKWLAVESHPAEKVSSAYVRNLAQFREERVISVNFTHGDRSNLAANERTGVVAASHWNNVDVGVDPPPVVELHNFGGKPSGAKLTWQWSAPVKMPAWHNCEQTWYGSEKLMDGRFSGLPTDNAAPWSSLTVSVGGIPYAQYRAYVYYYMTPSDAPEDLHTFGLAVNGGSPIDVGRPRSLLNDFYPYRDEAHSGNYQVFTGLAGDLSLDLTPTGNGSYHELFITGLQIVDSPPTATSHTKPGIADDGRKGGT